MAGARERAEAQRAARALNVGVCVCKHEVSQHRLNIKEYKREYCGAFGRPGEKCWCSGYVVDNPLLLAL